MSNVSTRLQVARFAHAALTDHLTELGNHRAYQEDFYREVSRALRHDEPLTLALIDVDEFKAINDQNGHIQGDLVLTALATLLHGGRAEDRAYRLGGDEFALLLPYTTMGSAVVMLERLRRDVHRTLRTTTISVGLAALTPGQADADTLQEQAAAALSEAKRRGRNTVATFDEIRESASILSSSKAQALRRLLVDGQVGVAFQPIWDVNRGEILAFEALTRPAAHYGFNGPQEAFDIAEKIGRAHDLDALCRGAILHRASELPANALLFLNVSPQTLDLDLLAGTTLVDAVVAAGLTPERVALELTERSMARMDVVIREATGAGNAGLEVLSQLPVDYVKIDRAVLVKALDDKTARAVLAGIIAIARETNTYVIAEGIEDSAMLALARRVGAPDGDTPTGVQGVQGYLLGRPSESIPAPTTVDHYRTHISAA
jgi:diguanylate cyclase (GGDEF)-like protein